MLSEPKCCEHAEQATGPTELLSCAVSPRKTPHPHLIEGNHSTTEVPPLHPMRGFMQQTMADNLFLLLQTDAELNSPGAAELSYGGPRLPRAGAGGAQKLLLCGCHPLWRGADVAPNLLCLL